MSRSALTLMPLASVLICRYLGPSTCVCVCVRACVCARARACVCACVLGAQNLVPRARPASVSVTCPPHSALHPETRAHAGGRERGAAS
jgi:hypothetical protein